MHRFGHDAADDNDGHDSHDAARQLVAAVKAVDGEVVPPPQAVAPGLHAVRRLHAVLQPTGLVLATLAMVDVPFNKYLKFVMPLMGILLLFSTGLLIVQVLI